MDYLFVLFVIAAVLEMGAAALIFIFKDMLHAILALAFVFAFSAALFLLVGQPMLALLQLFIMVGGVATYAFVGVSSESYSKFSHTNRYTLAVVFVLLVLILAYGAIGSNTGGNQQNHVSSTIISQSLGSGMGMVYFMALMLFGIGFGSIILMKRVDGRK